MQYNGIQILTSDITDLFPDICQAIHTNADVNKSKGKRNKKKH